MTQIFEAEFLFLDSLRHLENSSLGIVTLPPQARKKPAAVMLSSHRNRR